MIKELKSNKWIAFGGLPEDQQEFLKENMEHVQELRVAGKWTDPVSSSTLFAGIVYRLSPNYPEEKRYFLDVCGQGQIWAGNSEGGEWLKDRHGVNQWSEMKAEEFVSDPNFIEIKESELDYWMEERPGCKVAIPAKWDLYILMSDGSLMVRGISELLSGSSGYRWVKFCRECGQAI